MAIDPATGIYPFHGRQIAFALGLEGKQVGERPVVAESRGGVTAARDCHIAFVAGRGVGDPSGRKVTRKLRPLLARKASTSGGSGGRG